MEFFVGFFLLTAICSTVCAVFTTVTLWIGLGFLALFVIMMIKANYILRHDHSGDAGIPYLLCVLFPLLSFSVSFLLAALIKYIAVRSL